MTKASNESGRQDGAGHPETQHEIAERALRMKKDAGLQTQAPAHVTPHVEAVKGGQVPYSDTGVGVESTFTPNLKRSHNARSGDA